MKGDTGCQEQPLQQLSYQLRACFSNPHTTECLGHFQAGKLPAVMRAHVASIVSQIIDATQQQAKGILVSNMLQQLLQETLYINSVKPISTHMMHPKPTGIYMSSEASTLVMPR